MSVSKQAEVEAVQQYLRALLALGADHAARSELFASGVAASKINALYPAEFAALSPGLCELLRVAYAPDCATERATVIADPEYWAFCRGLTGHLWRTNALAKPIGMDASYNYFVTTAEYISLSACLKASSLARWQVDQFGRAVVVSQILWLAHWVATEDAAALPELAADLLALLEWALPDLPTQVARLRANTLEELSA